MAKGFGAKLANALAIGVGGLAVGYGKGTMEVAMRARDEYQQQLKDQRAAQAQQAAMEYERQATLEEREWKEGQSEAERAHDFEKMEKSQEFDLTLEEKRLANKIQLKRMGGGGGSGGINRTVKDAEGNIWGVTKTGEKIDLGIKGSVPSGGGDKTPAQVRLADELAIRRAKSEGREVTDEDKLRELERLTAKSSSSKADPNAVNAKDLSKAMKDEMEARNSYMHPGYKDWRNMSEEEKKKVAGAAVLGNYEASGAKVPEAFANRYRQESEAGAPQPGTIPAPATSTQGDKPKDITPTGSGTQASPYMATTEAQQRWVIENAPSGAFVSDGTKIFRKP